MEEERKLPPRKKVGPFNIDTMPPGTRRRAEEKNKGIRSRNVARAMSSSKDIPRRDTGDRPVVTKKNRGQQPTRRKARSLPRNVAKEMSPKGPPKGTKSSLERSKPTADPMTVTKTATKPKADAKTTPKVAAPPKVTKRPKVTGEGTDKASRNVSREGPMGKRTLANVTREQLTAAGLTTGPKGLNTYLHKFDELGRRPKPSDFKKPAEKKNKPTSPASARGRGIVKNAKGGMMKSKMKAKGAKKGGKRVSNAFAKVKAKMLAGGAPIEEKKKKVAGSPASGARRRPAMMAGGMMKSKMSTKGGMAGGKKKPPGMMGGGMMKSKMSTKGGAMGGKKKPPGMKAGGLKPAPEGNKGLKKLPKEVRNKMGFMKGGGKVKPKGAAAGGGYKQGGMKSKMATKQKVRGVGIARKGVRPVKMR